MMILFIEFNIIYYCCISCINIYINYLYSFLPVELNEKHNIIGNKYVCVCV